MFGVKTMFVSPCFPYSCYVVANPLGQGVKANYSVIEYWG